ncbi:hypothetical protein HY504_00885 [Candidatus Wolfebacteria bacterium]|nr:hypothetical protein [Candidatus Wolfebacteria bacterium]
MSAIINIFARRILSFVNPEPAVGGLCVADNFLRYAFIAGGAVKTASLRLPPEVIEGGRVKDAARFRLALAELHGKIAASRSKKMYVVLGIPDNNIYTQVFMLPPVGDNSFRDAVELNLQVISPTDYSQVYAGWQRIGEEADETGQAEILGAFAPRAVVDEFISSLSEANFVVVSVEFSSLALSRVFESGSDERLRAVLAVYLASGGLSFLILREGHLYFSRFVPWSSDQIKARLLEEIVVREVGRVINFYGSHWSSPLGAILYAAPNQLIGEMIRRSLDGKFSLPIFSLRDSLSSLLKKKDKNDAPNDEELVVFGSALRGAMARSSDSMINLMSVAARQEFHRQEFLNFWRVWRTAIITVLIFFIAIFSIADIFVTDLEEGLRAQAEAEHPFVETAESRLIRAEQKRINQFVELVRSVRNDRRSSVRLLAIIREHAGAEIIIDRVFIQGEDIPLVINARAPDEQGIIKFKEAIINNPVFSDVDVPLSVVTRTAEGSLAFTVSARVEPDIYRVISAPSADASSTP